MEKKFNYIDPTYLKEISGGDKKIIKEMIDIFFEQVPELTQEISQHFKTQNWNDLRSVTHKAKSSVRIMGMKKIGESLDKLEHLAKGNERLRIKLKENKGEILNEKEIKTLERLKYNLDNDENLKLMPELINFFLLEFPLAVKELEQYCLDL